MDNNVITKEWFSLAKKDIESAKFLRKMKPIPLEIICYHCQQSAEKYLKGFLAYNDQEVIKIHDLVFLNKKCVEYNILFMKIQTECLRLTDYSVNVRYPVHFDITEKDMILAIEDAERIQNFVLSLDLD